MANKSERAFAKAIELAGSQTALAAACGVTQAAISKALHEARVPAEWCPHIEKVTGGEVKRHELRPDLWSREDAR